MSADDETIPCVAFCVSADDVSLTEEMLADLGLACSSYTDLETRQARVWVFTESETAAATVGDRIAAAVAAWSGRFAGRLPAPAPNRLQREDWAHSWERFFTAFRVSPRLVLKPSWAAWTAAPTDIVLELDPGMCFGTGYHGTTRACLQFMDELAARLGQVAFLDAGCGSGILSLAAARLGFSPVYAFDHDPVAAQTARENLQRAGVRRVAVANADLAEYVPPRPCRVVAANLLATVLLAHRARLCEWLDGSSGPAYLVLSGILTDQYPDVRAGMSELGGREVERRTIDEWTSGCFELAQAERNQQVSHG